MRDCRYTNIGYAQIEIPPLIPEENALFAAIISKLNKEKRREFVFGEEDFIEIGFPADYSRQKMNEIVGNVCSALLSLSIRIENSDGSYSVLNIFTSTIWRGKKKELSISVSGISIDTLLGNVIKK